MKHWKRYVFASIPILLGLGLIVLLLLRIEVATGRFFDIDEYTHMHWASQIFHGQKPYLDFFTFFPPLYHWTLQPLFWLFPQNPDIFIAGRFISYFCFIGILAVLTIFFARLRSTHYALLPAFILAFLPMPYDKYFEIRPDTMSTFLGFVGILLLSFAWKEGESKKKYKLFFVAGIIFAACLLVLPKMLPFVMVAGAVVSGDILVHLWKKKGDLITLIRDLLKKKRLPGKDDSTRLYIQQLCSPLFFLVLGGGIIGVLFFIWMLSLGDFGTVWYSLTKMGVEGNKIGQYFIMEPHLFFFPNSSFYGGEGITLSFVVNHAIWVFAIFIATFRMITPFITPNNKKTTVLDEVMLSGIFFVSVYGYIYFFPLKHTQYLIPIGIFIAFYAADGLVLFFNWIQRTSLALFKASLFKRYQLDEMIGQSSVVALIVCLIIVGIAVNRELNARKLWWRNDPQQQQYTDLLKTVPKEAKTLDLEGKMIDWNDGYFVCCLAFGQFGYLLSHPLPDLVTSLKKNNVTYVFQGDSGRLYALPPEGINYITTNYKQVSGWGDKLWVRK